jgi:putative NADH-flavin reductase
MKLTVLGSTGGTGQEIVRQAAAAGHEVTAVARRENAVTEPGVRVAVGDLLDPTFLQSAVSGADAVLSTLGSREGRPPTTVYSAGIGATLDAMRATGVRRIVAVTAVPIAPKEQTAAFSRAVVFPILYQFFGGAYDDMRRMEAILVQGDRDWTVFRPPQLVNGPPTGHYRMAVDAPLAGMRSIRRADLAAAVLAAANEPTLIGHFVQIAN